MKTLLDAGNSEEDEEKLKPVLKSIYLNEGLCYWKLQQWKELEEICLKFLQKIDALNCKALYRLMTAYEKQDLFEKAVQVYEEKREKVKEEEGFKEV